MGEAGLKVNSERQPIQPAYWPLGAGQIAPVAVSIARCTFQAA
jgi:hypothetical protein